MWACAGELTIELQEGEPTAATIAEVERVLARGLAPSEETLGYGTLALAYERRGDPERAIAMADRGLAVLQAHAPTTSYTHWSIASIADVYLAAWARRGRGASELAAKATAVSGILKTAARAMPVVRPRASLVAARIAALEERTSAARRHYGAALDAARSLKMGVEIGLATRGLAELGR
jgi:hypothetical protein